jgi:hypothetical protein
MTDGLNLLDLADLPAPQRLLMRIIMREKSMMHDALLAAVSALPETQRLSEAEINDTLGELCRQGYLQQEMTNDGRRYQIPIARKPGKQLNSAIWNALGVDSAEDAPLRRGGSRTLSSAIWDTLDKKDEPTANPDTADLLGHLSAYKREPAPPAEDVKPPETPPDEAAKPEEPRRERKNLWDSLG